MADAGELKVRITGDNSDLKSSLADSSGQLGQFVGKVQGAMGLLAGASGILNAAIRGIEFNKAAESAKVAFTVMTGSAKTAEATLKSLRDYANKTPLEFADIRDATQTLIQFGLSAEKATRTIKVLGDVSGGDAQRLKQISLAFGQISSTGRLMGQDLLQLINAGFNPLQEISARTGKSMADLKKEMEKGLISFDMVEQAFIDATSEGGRFYGMLEKQSGTLAGKISTLNDAIDSSLGEITENYIPALKTLADVATGLLNVFQAMPDGIKKFTSELGPLMTIFGAAGPLVAGMRAFNNFITGGAIEGATARFRDVAEFTGVAADNLEDFAIRAARAESALKGTFTPEQFENTARALGLTHDQMARIVIQSTLIEESGKEIARNYLDQGKEAQRLAAIEQQRWDAQRKAYKEAEENFYRLNPQIARAAREQAERDRIAREAAQRALDLENAKNATRNAYSRGLITQEEQLRRIIALNEKEMGFIKEKLESGKVLSDAEAKTLRDLTAANTANQASLDAILERQKQIAAESEATAKAARDQAEALNQSLQASNNQFAAFSALSSKIDGWYQESLQSEEDLQKMREKGQKAAEAQAEKIKEEAESWKKLGENMFSYFSSLTSALTSLFQASAESRMNAVDEQVQAELEAKGLLEETEQQRLEREIQEAIAAGDTVTQAEKQDELDRLKIVEEGEKKKRQIQFETEKTTWKLKGLSILADIAKGIAASYTMLPPASFINAGIVTGVGVAQTAAHAAAEPKLWTGTTNPIKETAPYIVADQGTEMILPKGAEVLNNRDTMDMLGGKGGVRATFQVFLDSVLMAEKTADVFNNGLVRLEVS